MFEGLGGALSAIWAAAERRQQARAERERNAAVKAYHERLNDLPNWIPRGKTEAMMRHNLAAWVTLQRLEATLNAISDSQFPEPITLVVSMQVFVALSYDAPKHAKHTHSRSMRIGNLTITCDQALHA